MKASLARRLWQPVKVLVSRLWGPRMVGGFVRGDGEFLPHTRLSNSAVVMAREQLQVGDHVYIGHFTVLDATFGLRIGEGCQIAAGASIYTHSSHAALRLYGRQYVHAPVKKAYFEDAVEVGAFSYIGANALLMPGTRLGRGCVVSAFSYVKGSFPDFAILAGQPARVVGDTREVDERLLREHPELAAFYQDWAGELPVAPSHVGTSAGFAAASSAGASAAASAEVPGAAATSADRAPGVPTIVFPEESE